MGPGRFLVDWVDFGLFRSIPSIRCRTPSVDSGVPTPPSRFACSFRTFGRTLRDRFSASGGWLRQNRLLFENFEGRRRAPTTPPRLIEPPARFRLEIRTFGRDPSGMVLGDFGVFLGFFGFFGVFELSACRAPKVPLREIGLQPGLFDIRVGDFVADHVARAPFLI